MNQIEVLLVRYDMDKTKKRKRSNFLVDSQTEEAIIEKLEKIHKGEKLQVIHEIIWGVESKPKKSNQKVLQGRVKFFDTAKGFGFIEPDLEREDLFFHESALAGEDIIDHNIVEFQISSTPKGEVAIHIKRINQE